jgi:hypothetical protein
MRPERSWNRVISPAFVIFEERMRRINVRRTKEPIHK